MSNNTEIKRGLVSLTQIKLLAKEINKGYPFAECYKNSLVVYYVKSGHGFLNIVPYTYRLKEGESFFLKSSELKDLAYGFYNQNTSDTIYGPSLEYLYTEVNKRVELLAKSRPTEYLQDELYRKLQNFKHYFKKVSELPSSFYINYNDYDLSTRGTENANRAVTSLLTNLAASHNLKVKSSGKATDPSTNYYFSYYDTNRILPTDVYFYELNKFISGKRLTELDTKLLTDLFTYLYKADKEDFSTVITQNNNKYYGVTVEFLDKLSESMKEINLDGLTKWFEEAKKLRGNKAAIQELAKNKGEFK